MSEEAIRGLELFRDPEKGNCEVCHSINEEEGYALFSDNKFHNLGVGAEIDGTFSDIGRFEVSQAEAEQGAFKTPPTQNVTLGFRALRRRIRIRFGVRATAPFCHWYGMADCDLSVPYKHFLDKRA